MALGFYYAIRPTETWCPQNGTLTAKKIIRQWMATGVPVPQPVEGALDLARYQNLVHPDIAVHRPVYIAIPCMTGKVTPCLLWRLVSRTF